MEEKRLKNILVTLSNQSDLEPLRTTTYPASYVLEIAKAIEKAQKKNRELIKENVHLKKICKIKQKISHEQFLKRADNFIDELDDMNKFIKSFKKEIDNNKPTEIHKEKSND